MASSGSESKQPTLLDKPGEKRSEVKVPPRPEVTVTRKQPVAEEPKKQEIAVATVIYPVINVDKLVGHMKLLQELKTKLLTQEDWVMIKTKPFIKRSGWRKFALAFGISDEIVRAEREPLSDNGYVWRIWVKASELNGRSVIGVGSCSTREKEFVHEDHDLYATAHTRAKNRAISDLIGSGEISAEELTSVKETGK